MIVHRWSAKGLRSVKDASEFDRLVFTGPTSALLYKYGRVLATGLYKTIDSYVVPTEERVRGNLVYDPAQDQAPASAEEVRELITRFGLTTL